MRLMKGNCKIVLVLLSLFLLSALPAIASAQGRGRGRSQDKKFDKFVNGHDARDGRWDGRGPRGSRVGQRIWNDDDFFQRRRVRRGNRIFVPRNRHWGVDRDRDGDVDRRDFLLGRRHNRTDRFDRRHVRRQWRREDFRRR